MKGKAITFSAPSGSGKTTIVHCLLNRIPSLRSSISATTRKQRPLEIDGKDYYFLSVKDFKSKQKAGELLEWEEVYINTFYGTLQSEVERIWADGNHVIFDVDVKGGLKLKQILNDRILSIFVKIPSMDVLKSRLLSRNTESEESVNMRMNKAMLEMREEHNFDMVVTNDILDEAINEVESLVKDFIK